MATSGKDLDDSEATAQPTTTQHPQKEKGNFSTGYECEFVEPPPEILATECSVCLHIPREPHQVSCCGQHFCKSCIEHTWSENKPCPLCNRPDFTATLDKSVQRHLNALNVYCTNRRKGCEWVGELRELDHHLNANPRSGEELTRCEFVELSCIHGCGERFQRRSLPEHHNNCPSRPFSCEYCSHSSTYQDVVDNHWPECPHYPLHCPNSCEDSPIERQIFEDHQTTCPIRPFSCEYCGHLSTYRDVVNSHWPECPQYPLQCPNSCQDSQIERQHLGDHLNKECSLEKVNCEFQHAGCTAHVQRRDLAAHMRDNLPQHISQLSSTTRILAADIQDEIKQKLELQTTILNDQIEQCQQKAEGMVKQEQVQAQQEGQFEELKQMIKTASDNTQRQTQTSLQHTKTSLSRYSMIVAATILAFVAVFAAVIIMQQQIEKLRQDHIEATEQIQQLRQDHIEATEKLSDGLQHLQYELHHAPVLVSPSMCTAEGQGLLSTTMNKASEFTVSVVNIHGLPYSGERVNVIAELQSEEDGSITQTHISFVEASKYRVTFTPIVRGWNKLYVKFNNNIKGSPFSIFVSPENPQEIGGLNSPWGIAINSHGEIFVTEWGGDRVSVFGTSRQNRTIGSTGTGDGEFRYPTGIDIDADYNVYVASEYKLQKFNRNGEHVKSVNSSKEIRGVKVHEEKVYVCDRGNHRILVYDLELTLLRRFGTRGTGEGEFIRPYDIDFDAKGNAYVVDSGNNRVQVLNEDGQFQREFGREKLNYPNGPRGIHIDGDYVYVSTTYVLNKVVVFRTSGDFVTTIGENFGTVYGITTDSNGSLYICTYSLDRCIIL